MNTRNTLCQRMTATAHGDKSAIGRDVQNFEALNAKIIRDERRATARKWAPIVIALIIFRVAIVPTAWRVFSAVPNTLSLYQQIEATKTRHG